MRRVIVRDGARAARYDARLQRGAGAPGLRGNDVTGPSTFWSSRRHARFVREAAGAWRQMRWRTAVPAMLMGGILGACTLGVEEYQPTLVESAPLAPTPSPDAATLGCDAGV